MRKFAAGVLATVLAGLVLFATQEWLMQTFYRSKPELHHFEYEPKFLTSSDELTKWERALKSTGVADLDKANRVSVGMIIIRNVSSSPILDQSVVISSKYEGDQFDSGVIGFRNDVIPGKIGVDTLMSVSNGRLMIKYNLLDKNEMHRFWIISDRFADLQIGIRNPNLNVSGWDAKIYTPDDKNWSDYVGFSLTILVIGIFIGGISDAVITHRMLKRRGHDLIKLVSATPAYKSKEDNG